MKDTVGGVRILAVSDEITTTLHNANFRETLGAPDLLLGCGDLPYSYMESIVTHAEVRHAYYVHGNHDHAQTVAHDIVLTEPGGWRNVDRRVVYVRDHDVLIAGLEGSIRYRPGADFQYTENEMFWRALRLVPRLLINRVLHGRYLDILIAHSPAQGIHDEPDGAHRGFAIFKTLMRRFRPRLFLHGHNHRYGLDEWRTHFEDTEVINVHPFCVCSLKQDKVTVLYPRPDAL
jgi:uncharacterized protein